MQVQITKTVIQTSVIKHEDSSVFQSDILIFSSFLLISDIELLHLRGPSKRLIWDTLVLRGFLL